MKEFHHPEHGLAQFRFRLTVASIVIVLLFLVLLARLFWLQVLNYKKYIAQAEDNRITVLPIVPNRGLIFDRNGEVLARNYSAYTLELTPDKVFNLNRTIDDLSKIVRIEPRDRKRFKKLLDEAKSFESVPIRTRLNDEEVARFAAHSHRFSGVELKARLFREYPFGETAAHVIGYIGRISKKDAQRIADFEDAANYRGAQFIGKEGIEKRYERELRGVTGFEQVETAAGGRAVRILSRQNPKSGNNLTLSIDVRLQEVVEKAFGDRRGALVAIEPSTGEVLALVSKPSFDPNLFVEGIDIENWKLLNESPDRPLLNRPLAGAYPPGSTYKPFMSLAALELGKRKTTTSMSDPGYFVYGGHRFRDDKEGGHGTVDMYKSIVVSCDTYYYVLANEIGVDGIANFMGPLGFGRLTGIDLDGERKGVLPSTTWKRNAYRKPELKKWYAGETVSLAIGQGYNSFTPLQLAHATANLVNYGVVMQPRLVRVIEDTVVGQQHYMASEIKNRIAFKPEHINFIKRAMVGVNIEGTSAKVFANAPFTSGGKTGTAQVFSLKGEKYDAKRIHERLRDHALFIAFAPADQPRIALAVVVENGGFGAQAAAPIARTAIEAYLSSKKPGEGVQP